MRSMSTSGCRRSQSATRDSDCSSWAVNLVPLASGKSGSGSSRTPFTSFDLSRNPANGGSGGGTRPPALPPGDFVGDSVDSATAEFVAAGWVSDLDNSGGGGVAPIPQAGTSQSRLNSRAKRKGRRTHTAALGTEFQSANTFVVTLFVWFFPLMLSDRRLRRTRSGILPILAARRTP